jgi:hypothetical protein
MKSYRKFEFLLENGSHSKMKISGCDKLPLKRNLTPRFGESRDEKFALRR